MNRFVRLALLALIGLLAVAVAWLAQRPAVQEQAQGAKRIWNYSVWGPPRAFTRGIERVAEILREESGGELDLKIHYGSALAPERENIDAIKLGVIEAAHICVGYHPAKVPLAQVAELPFLLTDDVLVNARVLDALFMHPDIERELAERWNVKYLALSLLPQFELMGNRRVASVADLAGLRFRVLGGYGPLMQQVGAVSTMVTAPEVYSALERGTMDIVAFPWTDAFGAYRIYEVAKYATVGFTIPGFPCISGVSIDAWNALPEGLKALHPRLRKEAIDAQFRAYRKGDEHWEPIFRERLEIVHFPASERDKLIALSQRYWQQWAEETDAQGRPGTQMLQFMKDEIAKAQRELGR